MSDFGVLRDKDPSSPLRSLMVIVLNHTDPGRDLDEEMKNIITESNDYRHYMQEYKSSRMKPNS